MPGDLVTVKVSYNIPIFRKIIPYFNDDSFSITGESTVQIERIVKIIRIFQLQMNF